MKDIRYKLNKFKRSITTGENVSYLFDKGELLSAVKCTKSQTYAHFDQMYLKYVEYWCTKALSRILSFCYNI